MDKKISVCMATYNGERFIREQINSILPQLRDTDELIISDDGSTDKTLEIVREIADKRIKLFYNNAHNFTKNFENAISKSTGDIIFLCDQDDVWKNNKVEVMMSYLSEYDLVISNATIVDGKRNEIMPEYFKYSKVKQGFVYNLLYTRYIGACMAFNRKILHKVLPFPNNKLIPHDYWIACISELYYNTYLINEPLIEYRRHELNASSGIFDKSKLTLVDKLRKRIVTILHLIGRFGK